MTSEIGFFAAVLGWFLWVRVKDGVLWGGLKKAKDGLSTDLESGERWVTEAEVAVAVAVAAAAEAATMAESRDENGVDYE